MKYIFSRFRAKPPTPTLEPPRWTASLLSQYASVTKYATSKLSGADGTLRNVWQRGKTACGTTTSPTFSATVIARFKCQMCQFKKLVTSPTATFKSIPWATYTLNSGRKVFYPAITAEIFWVLVVDFIVLVALLLVLIMGVQRLVAFWGQKHRRGRDRSVEYEYSAVRVRTPSRGRDRSLNRTVDVAAVTDKNGKVVGRRRKSRGVRFTDRKMEKYEEAWMAKWAAMDD